MTKKKDVAPPTEEALSTQKSTQKKATPKASRTGTSTSRAGSQGGVKKSSTGSKTKKSEVVTDATEKPVVASKTTKPKTAKPKTTKPKAVKTVTEESLKTSSQKLTATSKRTVKPKAEPEAKTVSKAAAKPKAGETTKASLKTPAKTAAASSAKTSVKTTATKTVTKKTVASRKVAAKAVDPEPAPAVTKSDAAKKSTAKKSTTKQPAAPKKAQVTAEQVETLEVDKPQKAKPKQAKTEKKIAKKPAEKKPAEKAKTAAKTPAKAAPKTSTEADKTSAPAQPDKSTQPKSTKQTTVKKGKEETEKTVQTQSSPKATGKSKAAKTTPKAIKTAARQPSETPETLSDISTQPAKDHAQRASTTDLPESITPEPVLPNESEPSVTESSEVVVKTNEPIASEIVVSDTQRPAVLPLAPLGDEASSPEAIILSQLGKLGRPVHLKDLEKSFTRATLDRLGGWRSLQQLLEDLVDEAKVLRVKKGIYGLPENMNLVRGRFQAVAGGFGFVIPDSRVGESEDYFIPEGKTREAWNGDIVLVRPEGRGDTRDNRPRRGQKGDGNPRARVVQFVQRAYQQVVGTLEFEYGHPILKADDHRARHRIFLFPEGTEDLEAGARVVAKLFWPETTGEDEVFGQVVRVLGTEDDPETETEAVMVKFALRGEFPPEVEEQAAAIPLSIPAEALEGRLDLRSRNTFTVDGRDAKDFDDAIHIEPTGEGTFILGIHIADVSHYVREGTPLDTEAYARATSVYLPGRVLPMLPEHLSNGVCSLVPHEDRLTLSALVEVSAEGDIMSFRLTPSVIHSKARLTYDEVQDYSEAKSVLPEHARHLEGDLHLLLKVTTKLRQKRLREGSLDFKLNELKVDVQQGRLELIPIREETARGMIEDLMLLANKVVAKFLLERDIPTLFRVHEEPTLQRFQEVTAAIGRMGLAFAGSSPTPQAYQAVLKKVRGTPREGVVNTLLLRSMQQARYAHENLGHFGLAFQDYLHFTSPIRRYPDLVVHRTIKKALTGQWKSGSVALAQFQSTLPAMAEHTSDRERIATEAERDLAKYYQCKWAQEHLGERFLGSISGVVSSGFYVTLENGVEGRVHISALHDDYYVFVEEAQMLKGRHKNHAFRLGDSLEVSIAAVKPLARQIDLVPAALEIIDMTETKVRARRREEREAEHREKLQSVQVSPKRFTLEEPTPPRPTSPRSPRPAQTERRGYRRPDSGQGYRDNRDNRDSRDNRETYRSDNRRRVYGLDRSRTEHLRPVNITVQRMYFGEWTADQLGDERHEPPARAQQRYRSGGHNGNNGNGSNYRPARTAASRPAAKPRPEPREPRPEYQQEAQQEAQQEVRPSVTPRAEGRAGGVERVRVETASVPATPVPEVPVASDASVPANTEGEVARRRRRRERRSLPTD